MKSRTLASVTVLAILAILSLLQGSALADVLPPEPRTTWGRGKGPSETGVIIAGIALSAAVAVSGLILVRTIFPQSPRAKLVVLGVTVVVVAVVVLGVCRNVLLIREDQAKWDQWEVERSSRRYGGREPSFPGPSEVPLPSEKEARE